MEIKLKEITVREVANGYTNNNDEGVIGYSGKLNIRPKYQREFVYKDKQREEVINTINNGFPLNVMYWVKNEDNTYEVLDGQQRTISFCQYINNDFSINSRAFHNLTETEKNKILDYKLMIYICEGNDKERLDWFKIINIAGEKLSDQELRNAIYTGEWLTDAKRYFSKNNCVAYQVGNNYLNGEVNRQAYLESAIRWIAEREGKTIEDYMSKHQHDTNANELWLYFKRVLDWVQVTFQHYRKEMKGLDWGIFFNKYGNAELDPNKLEKEIKKLMMDEDVTSKKGIYEYLLDGKEKHLSIREFTPNQKREAYERQKGICQNCQEHFDIEEMEADHITPWHAGGKSIQENCQMLCRECNRRKSGI